MILAFSDPPLLANIRIVERLDMGDVALNYFLDCLERFQQQQQNGFWPAAEPSQPGGMDKSIHYFFLKPPLREAFQIKKVTKASLSSN